MKAKQRKILTYAIIGFMIGLLFPLLSLFVELSRFGMELSFSSLKAIHHGQPLMLIIDSVPIVLSASFALIGIQASKFTNTSDELDERIKDQAIIVQNEGYFLEALIANTAFAVVRLDKNHHIITGNQAFEDLFGYSNDEIIGRHLDEMIAFGDLITEASQLTTDVTEGKLVRKVSKRKRKDGSLVDVDIIGVPVSVGGENIGILGIYHDISQQVETEKALLESEIRFKTLFDESPISLWEEDFSAVKQLFDQIGDTQLVLERLTKDDDLVKECIGLVKILNVNQATVDLYMADSKTDLLANLADVLIDESHDEFRKELMALASGKLSYECEIYQKKFNGDVIYGWMRYAIPPGYEDTLERVYISIIDITDRKIAEDKLRFVSFHDALTGVYNRAYFEEELKRLQVSRQYPISIINCDLDGLKQINDNLGHDVGDRAIKAAAKILGAPTFRKEDIVARIGGDEFVILLPSVDLDKIPAILERLDDGITNFNKSKVDDGLYRPISLSCGHAVVHQGGSLEAGYKDADQAMYANKAKNKATPKTLTGE